MNKYYVIIENNLLIGNEEILQKLYPLFIVEQLPVDYEENKYIISDKKLVLNPSFEEQKELEEKERVARLNMTKLDFATYLQEYGVSYSQLKSVLASNDNAQMQWDLCERVYRFNPLLDELAKGFGVTPEQLDTMFKKANGEVI